MCRLPSYIIRRRSGAALASLGDSYLHVHPSGYSPTHSSARPSVHPSVRPRPRRPSHPTAWPRASLIQLPGTTIRPSIHLSITFVHRSIVINRCLWPWVPAIQLVAVRACPYSFECLGVHLSLTLALSLPRTGSDHEHALWLWLSGLWVYIVMAYIVMALWMWLSVPWAYMVMTYEVMALWLWLSGLWA